jgi:undecaprenyl-phosphate galactose phosphotransferase
MNKLKKVISLIFIIISDFATLFVSFLIAFFLRSQILPLVFSGFKQPPLPLAIQVRYGFFYGAIIIIIIFAFEKLYTKRFAFWEETKHLIKGITLSFILIMMIVFVSRRYTQYSRAVIILAWSLSLIIFPISRVIIKNLLVKFNLWKKKIVILGTNGIAKLVAEEIDRNKTIGYEVVGFLSERRKNLGKKIRGIKIIGEINELEKITKNLGIKDIIIAIPNISQNRLIKLIESCERNVETIRMIPHIGNIFSMGIEIENFGDILALSVPRNLVKPWNIVIKNLFEFILVFVFFIILIPLFLIISIAIKLDSSGPVLFVQERLGEKGRIFKCFKFRSMYINSDEILEKWLEKNPKARKEWEKYQKIKSKDPRITKIGKLIRKYSLDELPQIINFLKRDMNLVGPRPYLPREKEKIGKSYQIISKVKPGITGLWQVRGRNLLTFRERILLDEYYIRNWSLWLDIIILLKTIKVFITKEGAY